MKPCEPRLVGERFVDHSDVAKKISAGMRERAEGVCACCSGTNTRRLRSTNPSYILGSAASSSLQISLPFHSLAVLDWRLIDAAAQLLLITVLILASYPKLDLLHQNIFAEFGLRSSVVWWSIPFTFLIAMVGFLMSLEDSAFY